MLNLKFSEFLCCLHLFFDYAKTEVPLVSTVFYAELRGAFYTSQMGALRGDLGSGRPSSPIISSRTLCRIFIKLCLRVRYKTLLPQTNFHENRLSDSHLTGLMSLHFCQQSRNEFTLPTTTTVYSVL
jgi:hypothetical protein